MGFKEPNYTQTPNELFDECMKKMGEAELRVTLAVIRKTMGYHKDRDAISYSQIMEMTGLSRSSTQDGINKAVEHGFIEIAGNGKRGVNIFRLVVNPDQSGKATSTGSVGLPVTGSVTLPTKETEKENSEIKSEKRTKSKPSAEVIFRQEWSQFASIGDALLQAFGLGFVPAANQTITSLESYLDVAKELTAVQATVEQIPALYKYIKERAQRENWSTFGVKTLARYYTDFLKVHRPIKAYEDPSMDLSIPQTITPILIREAANHGG